jgi:hypothetical protein
VCLLGGGTKLNARPSGSTFFLIPMHGAGIYFSSLKEWKGFQPGIPGNGSYGG